MCGEKILVMDGRMDKAETVYPQLFFFVWAAKFTYSDEKTCHYSSLQNLQVTNFDHRMSGYVFDTV